MNTSATSRLLSPSQLLNACWLVARVLVPLALLCLIELYGLQLLYLRDPARTDRMRQLSSDYFIVLEQMRRAAEVPAPDVAFLGDSSCLMGIDPRILERELGRAPVQSFCSIAFIGPAGYAHMLSEVIARGASPKVLVFMFHPAAFRREPAWEPYTNFVLNAGRVAAPALQFPGSALDYLKFEWLSRPIYSPLPGLYASYYGGMDSLLATIETRQGSAVDPATGLNVRRLDDLQDVSAARSNEAADFSANSAYFDALKILADVTRKLPASTSIYLVVSPVQDDMLRPGSLEQRAETASGIALTLGIDVSHILNTSATLHPSYFSGRRHLNRWGQQVFSREVSAALRPTQ